MSYENGYGKPPKKNQFNKGQSGNPSGRPVREERNHGRSVDMITYLDKALRRKIEINERGVTKKISILEATINKQVQKALIDGDQKALAQVFSLADKVYRAFLAGHAGTPLRIIVTGGLPDD